MYSYLGVLAFGRNRAFGRRIPVQELNEKFALISRVVLHPKYRSIGLGVRLVKETLPLVDRPYVEMIAVMAMYNPFAEKAGMQKIAERVPEATIMKAVESLRPLGFNPIFLGSKKQNLKILKGLSERELEKVKETLVGISSGYYKRLKGAHRAYVKKCEFKQFVKNATLEQLAGVLRKLAILTESMVYLFWRKPDLVDR